MNRELEVRRSVERVEEENGRTRLRVVREMECPRCHQFHRIDTLEEELGITLYCDTYNENIPLERHHVEAIRAGEAEQQAKLREWETRSESRRIEFGFKIRF